MAGTVAIMLQQASVNSDRAVLEAEKLLLPEQWSLVPTGIRERLEVKSIPAG